MPLSVVYYTIVQIDVLQLGVVPFSLVYYNVVHMDVVKFSVVLLNEQQCSSRGIIHGFRIYVSLWATVILQ